METGTSVSSAQLARAFSSKRLDLTILPTEKCNFRCTYCYEDFSIGRMKSEVVKGLKLLIEKRSADLLELETNWFGGEPLLALPVIEEICGFAMDLASKCGFSMRGGLTTNGYLLTPQVLERLVMLNQVFFQITLDGWNEIHDETRRRADGKGTFERIWMNLLEAKKTDLSFTIQLRIHVTNSNHNSLVQLSKQIYSNFGGDGRFRCDFQDVRNLGGDNGEKIVGVSAKEFRRRIEELRSIVETGEVSVSQKKAEIEIDEMPKGESAGSRLDYVKTNQPYVCYAAKPNHLLVRANGRIGKCTVALNDDRNDLGSLNSDGTITIDQDKVRSWSRGFETQDLLDLSCPLAKLPKQKNKKQIDVVAIA